MKPKGNQTPGASASRTSSTPSSSGVVPRTRKMVGGQPRGNPARRGSPSPADTSPISNSPGISHSSLAAPVGGSLCGSCEVTVGDDGIGCDKCSTWFHPSSLCLGLSDRVIDAIREAGGDGIEFVCTQCRARSTGSGSSSSDSAISQLSVMVKSLCAVVAKLTERVDQLFTQSTLPPPPPSAPVSVPSGDDLRNTIREEIVEMEERRKRRDSLIFRGVVAATNDTALTKIKDIVIALLNSTPALTNLYCINRDVGIYRVTMPDDDCRKQLLNAAKNLRNNPQYQGIYINRDLTFKQRKILYDRRQRLRSANASGQQSNAHSLPQPKPGPSNDPPVPTSTDVPLPN